MTLVVCPMCMCRLDVPDDSAELHARVRARQAKLDAGEYSIGETMTDLERLIEESERNETLLTAARNLSTILHSNRPGNFLDISPELDALDEALG